MIRKIFWILLLIAFSIAKGNSQPFIKTSDLFRRHKENPRSGHLNIIQNPSIDTLISRYILVNKNLYDNFGYFGMEGFRIQIYLSSNINAREESAKVKVEFMNKFRDIKSYALFAQPVWYKIRVGDFRSKTEAYKSYLIISKEFPNSDLVRDFIYFPDLNKK
jgi:hypothetical protein